MNWLPLFIIIQYPIKIQFLYYGLCLIIAFLGWNKTLGFWGNLFFSILFSPVAGMFVVLISRKKRLLK
jgi:hypothetical protein